MGFGTTLQRKSLYCKIFKEKFPASLKYHLARHPFFLDFTTKSTALTTLRAPSKCRGDKLTVMMNGTVLIISRMKEMRKICSQMFP